MTTVTTKAELKKAIKNKQYPILCTGEIAQKLIKTKIRTMRLIKIGITIALIGLCLLPFTFGTSTGLTIAGLTLGGGAVVISIVELCIILGVLSGLSIFAILKGKNIKIDLQNGIIEFGEPQKG